VIDLKDPKVMVGLFIGGLLPFVFSALSIQAVSRAAEKMIEEVRRQFREIPGIMEGTGRPEYERCVDISTAAALREMILPGLMAVLAPVVVGFGLGAEALGGLLGGSIVTGVMMAIFMSNAGGAWDNAKNTLNPAITAEKGQLPMQQPSSEIPLVTLQGYSRPESQYPHKAHVGRCYSFGTVAHLTDQT
jgi:Inorganic pyrophosphatase